MLYFYETQLYFCIEMAFIWEIPPKHIARRNFTVKYVPTFCEKEFHGEICPHILRERISRWNMSPQSCKKEFHGEICPHSLWEGISWWNMSPQSARRNFTVKYVQNKLREESVKKSKTKTVVGDIPPKKVRQKRISK